MQLQLVCYLQFIVLLEQFRFVLSSLLAFFWREKESNSAVLFRLSVHILSFVLYLKLKSNKIDNYYTYETCNIFIMLLDG